METQVMLVGSAKTDNLQRRIPRIRLGGFWLGGIGFEPEMIATAEYEKGSIILKLQGSGIDTYKSLAAQARINQTLLLYVRQEFHNKKHTPYIEIRGAWLEKLGFTVKSVILVRTEYGLIRIKLIDPDKLDL